MKADYPQLSYRKHTFLTSLVSGLSAVIVTLIICATGIIIYGMSIASDKSEEIISLAQSTIHGLPAIQKSLPPVVEDVFNDRRDPAYRDKVEITAEPSLLPQDNGRLGASVILVNKGSKVVSLMSLRITILNSKNEVLSELNHWVVTPFTNKNDWPGPLMPDSKRYISLKGKRAFNYPNTNGLKTEVEVTELRIWDGQKAVQPADANAPAEADEPEQAASLMAP
jgi:hypothetical protein